MTAAQKRNKVLRVMNKLQRNYGRREPPSEEALMERVLLYLLYYGGGATAARRALKALQEQFVDLNEVRVSGLAELGALFGDCGISPTVAPLVKQFLRQIFANRGTLDLNFLRDASGEQMRKYFARINALPQHGINYVVASTRDILLIPVDENALRIAKNLSLVEQGADVARGEHVLKRLVPKKKYFDFYFLLLEHSRKICGAKPHCSRCVLLSECNSSAAKAVS